MDPEMMHSAELLRTLADCRERMILLTVELRSSPQISTVSSGADIRRYKPGGTRIELFVDAELHDRSGISWWLELVCDAGTCVVEGSVNQNGRDGQEVLDDLGTWHVDSLNEATERLSSITELFATHRVTAQLMTRG